VPRFSLTARTILQAHGAAAAAVATCTIRLADLFKAAVVDVSPDLLPGEQRVLGQTLSTQVALLRNLHRHAWRQDPHRVWAQVLDDTLETHDKNVILDNLASKLGYQRNIRGKRTTNPRLLTTNLPPDILCHPDIEAFTISQNDPREGLRGQRGLRVKESAGPIPEYALLGPYRAHMLTKEEYNQSHPDGRGNDVSYSHGRDPRFWAALDELRGTDRELLFESYGADYKWPSCMAQEGQASMTVIGSMQVPLPMDFDLVSSGYGFGNLTALANDAKGPIDEEQAAEDIDQNTNARLVEILVHGWPFIFMFAIRRLHPGEEILMSYGPAYWPALKDLLRLGGHNIAGAQEVMAVEPRAAGGGRQKAPQENVSIDASDEPPVAGDVHMEDAAAELAEADVQGGAAADMPPLVCLLSTEAAGQEAAAAVEMQPAPGMKQSPSSSLESGGTVPLDGPWSDEEACQ